MVLQHLLEEAGRVALVAVGNVLRRSAGEHGATTTATLGTHVDDPVGLTDDVEVVLNDDDGVAAGDETAQNVHEDADVLEMQTGGGLVEDIDGAAGVALRQLGGKLDALALTTREGGGGLSKLDIAEADVLNGLDLAQDVGDVLEEFAGLIDGHVKHVGNGLALIAHLKGLAIVPLAVADLAGHLDIRQEIHLDGLIAIAATGLAAASLDVERETAGLVTTNLGFRQADEQRADVAEHTGIGGWIGARRTADGRLVDTDDLVDVFQTLDAVVGQGCLQRVVEMLGE